MSERDAGDGCLSAIAGLLVTLSMLYMVAIILADIEARLERLEKTAGLERLETPDSPAELFKYLRERRERISNDRRETKP